MRARPTRKKKPWIGNGMSDLQQLLAGDVTDFNRPPATEPELHTLVHPYDAGSVLALLVGESSIKGGPGSGNFDHSGRPGHVGGSASSGNAPAKKSPAKKRGKATAENRTYYEDGRMVPRKGERVFAVFPSIMGTPVRVEGIVTGVNVKVDAGAPTNRSSTKLTPRWSVVDDPALEKIRAERKAQEKTRAEQEKAEKIRREQADADARAKAEKQLLDDGWRKWTNENEPPPVGSAIAMLSGGWDGTVVAETSGVYMGLGEYGSHSYHDTNEPDYLTRTLGKISEDHPYYWKPSSEKSMKGGAGSGNHGHVGRPGKRGGSAPKGASAATVTVEKPAPAKKTKRRKKKRASASATPKLKDNSLAKDISPKSSGVQRGLPADSHLIPSRPQDSNPAEIYAAMERGDLSASTYRLWLDEYLGATRSTLADVMSAEQLRTFIRKGGFESLDDAFEHFGEEKYTTAVLLDELKPSAEEFLDAFEGAWLKAVNYGPFENLNWVDDDLWEVYAKFGKIDDVLRQVPEFSSESAGYAEEFKGKIAAAQKRIADGDSGFAQDSLFDAGMTHQVPTWRDETRVNPTLEWPEHGEEWIAADVAGRETFKNRIARDAHGQGVVSNDDSDHQAREYAKRQNALRARLNAAKTPVERAKIYGYGSRTVGSPLSRAARYLREHEGIDPMALPENERKLLVAELLKPVSAKSVQLPAAAKRFDYQPMEGSPVAGYAVPVNDSAIKSWSGNATTAIPLAELTEIDVYAHLVANKSVWDNLNAHAGAWLDTETGMVYLDAVVVAESPSAAKALCVQTGQEDYDDLTLCRVISISTQYVKPVFAPAATNRKAGNMMAASGNNGPPSSAMKTWLATQGVSGPYVTKFPTPRSPISEMANAMAIKSVGRNRVGAYLCVWGNPMQKDLSGEYFTPRTQEMTAVFDVLGKLPAIYHHAMDTTIKSAVIGLVDTMRKDDVGMWVEAQIREHEKYQDFIAPLVQKGMLGWSSGAFPGARTVNKATGEILRWPVIEASMTPTPMEWRMVANWPIRNIKAVYQQAGLSTKAFNALQPVNGAADTDVAAELELLRLLELAS